jgi:uncharacterized protein (DUF488 family)
VPVLLTVGHGTLEAPELVARLVAARVELLVDVRRFPGSRRNPTVGQVNLSTELPAAGIAYRWDERLGGRRRLPREEPAVDTWWTVAAFRAYAAHTRTSEFNAARRELAAEISAYRTVVMCSESLWWRCHRRLIADVMAVGDELAVSHLMPNGRLVAHVPAPGARRRADGQLVWDVDAP